MKNKWICFLYALFFMNHLWCQESILLPFLDGENYGVINSEGDFIIQPTSDRISISNKMGIVEVHADKLKDIYNASGEIIQSQISQNSLTKRVGNLETIQVFNSRTKEVYFIHVESKKISKIYTWPGNRKVKQLSFLIQLQYDNGSILLDRYGNQILKDTFSRIDNFESAVYVKHNRQDSSLVIFDSGSIILKGANSFSHHSWTYSIVNHKDGSYVTEKNGDVIQKFDTDRLQYFKDSLVVVDRDDKLVLTDMHFNERFSIEAQILKSPQNELGKSYSIFKKHKWGILDARGKVLIPPTYDYIKEFGDNGLSLQSSEGVLFVDAKLDTISFIENIAAPFYKDTQGELIYVISQNAMDPQAGVMNKQGQLILKPFTSDRLEINSECNIIQAESDLGHGLYNSKGRLIYSHNSYMTFSCHEDKLKLIFDDRTVEIDKEDGAIVKTRLTNRDHMFYDWDPIKKTRCPEGTNSNLKCLEIKCGPYEGTIIAIDNSSFENQKMYVDGKSIIPEGCRVKYTTPHFFSVTKKVGEDDTNYKMGLMDWDGNWVTPLAYAELSIILDGTYFVYTDIQKLTTKIYGTCDKFITEEYDVIEMKGLSDQKKDLLSGYKKSVVLGKVTNKKELRAALKDIELKNYNQIKKDLFRKVEPKYEYSLYSSLLGEQLLSGASKIQRLDKAHFIVNKNSKSNQSLIYDYEGNELRSYDGQLERIQAIEKSYLKLKQNDLYGLVDLKGRKYSDMEYDSITSPSLSDVFFLFKNGDTYIKVLKKNNSDSEEEIKNPPEVKLGQGAFTLRNLSPSYFSVVDENKKDEGSALFSYAGEFYFKTKYKISSNKICSLPPPLGYLKAYDVDQENGKPFFINLKTGEELRSK